MKIIIVLTEPLNYPNLTALPRCVYEIAKRIPDRYDISILTSGYVDRHYIIDHLTVHELKATSITFFGRVRRFLADSDVDIIHFYGSLLGSNLLVRSLKGLGKPIVLNIYTLKPRLLDFTCLKVSDLFHGFSHIFKQPYFLSSLVPLFLLRKGLKNSSVKKIVVPSLRLQKQLKGFLGENNKVVQIPHGIDFNRFADCSPRRIANLRKKLGFGQNDKLIMYFGRSVLVRGIDELIHALGIAQKDIPNLRACFLLMPSGNITRIEKAANKILSPNSVWVSARFVKNVEEYIAMADVIVLPYRFSGDLPEYPFAMLESMAASKPIVTTNVGAVSELIKNGRNGLVIRPRDKKRLAEAIVRLSTFEDLATKYGQMAKQAVEGFDWDFVCQRILEVYSEAEIKGQVVSSFFDNLSPDYDTVAFYKSRGLEYLSEIEEEFISRNVPVRKGDCLLCVGIGTGRNASLFAQKGVIIDGIDISEGMMKEAKKKLSDKNVRFTVADAGHHIPFASNTFDYVLCMRVLKYILTWEQTIKEVSRVLKEGGIFVLDMANQYSVQFLGRRGAIYHLFKFKDVKKTLEVNSFQIVELKGGSRFPYPLYRRINSKRILGVFKRIESFLNVVLPRGFSSRNLLLACRHVQDEHPRVSKPHIQYGRMELFH